jgi:HD-like signal output (HDOD) protein
VIRTGRRAGKLYRLRRLNRSIGARAPRPAFSRTLRQVRPMPVRCINWPESWRQFMTTMSTSAQTPELNFADRDKVIKSAVEDVSHIATLPEVTVRIIELVENPDSTAHDLHMVITNDPALSARVLKVVNSAFYALPGQIGSINRAIVLLGLNAVKNIAIAASLAKLFRGGRLCPDFAARDLWEHSIGVAAGVRLLSEKIRLGLPDEAFLAGLIHDIGIMIEMQVRRPKLVQVFELMKSEQTSFRQAEMKVFGVTHEHFGQALCEKWKFPVFLSHVAGFHHRPLELAAESRTLASLVHVADVLAAQGGFGYGGTVDRPEIRAGVKQELRLTEPMLEEVTSEMPAAVEVADSILG